MQRRVEVHRAMQAPKSMVLTSDAFGQGKAIPREHTCHGDDVSPPMRIGNVPDGAEALALVVDDPDAPSGTFTHWTAWNLKPDVQEVPRGADVRELGGVEGANDFGVAGWRGPCPPSGTHRYFFRVFALREPLSLRAGAGPAEVWDALAGRTLAWGETMGTFTRP